MHADKAQCIATGGRATCHHLPAKGSVPLKVKGVEGRSAVVGAEPTVPPPNGAEEAVAPA
jgi:hypothetical protein